MNNFVGLKLGMFRLANLSMFTVFKTVEVLNQSFRAMNSVAAGDTHPADPVNTVHHEMYSAVHSDGFYKSV